MRGEGKSVSGRPASFKTPSYFSVRLAGWLAGWLSVGRSVGRLMCHRRVWLGLPGWRTFAWQELRILALQQENPDPSSDLCYSYYAISQPGAALLAQTCIDRQRKATTYALPSCTVFCGVVCGWVVFFYLRPSGLNAVAVDDWCLSVCLAS